MLTVGSRAQVWNGNAKKTSGGLTKKDLFRKKGRIKSRKASQKAKKNKNLKKAGWTFKKGEFGAVRIEDKQTAKKTKKRGSKKRSHNSLSGPRNFEINNKYSNDVLQFVFRRQKLYRFRGNRRIIHCF